MSSDQPHEQPHLHTSQPQILRPLPRRPFELNLTPATSSSSASSQPSPNPSNNANNSSSSSRSADASLSAQLDARLGNRSATPADDADVRRTRSILNLTASTLSGIYQPTAGSAAGDNVGSEPPTPWGTGALTPGAYVGGGASSSELREWEHLRLAGLGSRNATNPAPSGGGAAFLSSSSPPPPPPLAETGPAAAGSRKASVVTADAVAEGGAGGGALGRVARGLALFGFGVVYGVLISHLHDNRHIAPVRVEGINRGHWGYLAFWGLAGVALGSALPWVDLFWEGRKGAAVADLTAQGGKKRATGQAPAAVGTTRSRDGTSQEWNDVVRSVGAFVGIAFAIRKLQWQSTAQISATLALVNPALWYLLDRSKPGFTLSMLVGITGTAIMLLLGQHSDSVAFIPSPPIVGGSGPNASVRLGARITGTSAAGEKGGGPQTDYESTVGVATWFASVLFCSCVCFGNIGRKLALQG